MDVMDVLKNPIEIFVANRMCQGFGIAKIGAGNDDHIIIEPLKFDEGD